MSEFSKELFRKTMGMPWIYLQVIHIWILRPAATKTLIRRSGQNTKTHTKTHYFDINTKCAKVRGLLYCFWMCDAHIRRKDNSQTSFGCQIRITGIIVQKLITSVSKHFSRWKSVQSKDITTYNYINCTRKSHCMQSACYFEHIDRPKHPQICTHTVLLILLHRIVGSICLILGLLFLKCLIDIVNYEWPRVDRKKVCGLWSRLISMQL